MHTLLYVFTVLLLAHFITTSQALGLEALTPCALTASNGAVVQAYCEETITPCVLTASNGAIVQAYCEPSLVDQPLASISALQNATSTTSFIQILGTGNSPLPTPTTVRTINWSSLFFGVFMCSSNGRQQRSPVRRHLPPLRSSQVPRFPRVLTANPGKSHPYRSPQAVRS